MRVISGELRGRRITAPVGRDTRPTSDRVREAVFSSVMSRLGSLDGVHVLDLYAGSGALGIEALSRGAEHVTFVENDRRTVDVIRRNITSLGIDSARAHVITADAERLRADALVAGPVALLFVDPPYRIDAARIVHILEGLGRSDALNPGTLVVYEHARNAAVRWPPGFSGEQERSYGDTGVSLGLYEGGT